MACNAIEIAGQNRVNRKIVIDGFRNDPAYRDGTYGDRADLSMGQTIFAYVGILVVPNPYRMQAEYPTRAASEKMLQAFMAQRLTNPVDPNDTIYQFDASRNYNPAPQLSNITVPVLWINSAHDFLNPPGLGNPEELASRMPKARFKLIPASEETRGHGTHSAPRFWKNDLGLFLAEHP